MTGLVGSTVRNTLGHRRQNCRRRITCPIKNATNTTHNLPILGTVSIRQVCQMLFCINKKTQFPCVPRKNIIKSWVCGRISGGKVRRVALHGYIRHRSELCYHS